MQCFSDDLEGNTSPSDPDLYAAASGKGSLSELSEGTLKSPGHTDKLSVAECGENYDPLLAASLTDVNRSSSSFSSNSSSHALLNVAGVVGEVIVEGTEVGKDNAQA